LRIFSILIFLIFILTFSYNLSRAEPYIFLIRKGNSYYKKELYQEALSCYSKAQQKREKEIEPLFNSGSTLYMMEDYVGAIDAFTKVLQEKNTDLKHKAYYNLGNSYYKLGEYDKAASNYIKALELNPHDFNTKHNLEMALQKIEENTEKSKMDEIKGQKPEEQKKDNGEKGKSEEKQTEKPVEGETQLPEELLSPDEARSLINALNTDQNQTIKEIIQKKIGKVENEKDW